MKKGSYLLVRTDGSTPIDTVCSFSENAKKNMMKITRAPYEAVAATFAALELEQENAGLQEEKNDKAKAETKVEQKFDTDTEARITSELQKILEAPNQLQALTPHLNNMIVGEDNTKKAVCVLNLSGKCKSELKQIILFKATEGAGKSTLMRTTTKGYKIKDIGRFSSHALDYTDLQGYEILSLKELGIMDEETQGVSTLKFLSSDDNGYTVEVTVRDEETGHFTTEQHTIPPITTVSSTTRLALDPQFERRAWLFGVDESEEQTKRIAQWLAENQHQKDEKLLGKRKLTEEEFSTQVFSRFIQQFKPIEVIIPFPKAIVNTLSFNVLRVRGDIGKLLAFCKFYAMLNRKRLEKVSDEIYTLTPEVAVEALTLALQPIAGMLARIDSRANAVFGALKQIASEESDIGDDQFDKKGAEISKAVRDKIAVKIKRNERTVRDFLSQLAVGGYIASDGKKPVTYTLLYNINDIEAKTSGLLEKIKSADNLITEMWKEAQEWVKTVLENISVLDGLKNLPTDTVKEEKNNEILLPSTEENISNRVLGSSQTNFTEQGLDSWRIAKLPIKQGISQEASFYFERIKPSEKCDCGAYAAEYKVTINTGPLKGDILCRCEGCFRHLQQEFYNQVWQEIEHL